MTTRHILIVDDNPDDATVLSHTIELLMHHQVTQTSRGAEALDIARKTLFDMVLLDLNLPDLYGLVVADALRQIDHYKRVPIIAITGYDPPHAQARSSCDALIEKPVNIDALIALVTRYLTH